MALKKFLMIGVVAGLLVACGDDASDKSPVQVAEVSSSSVDEVLSSSVNVEESSSSFESEGLSSSVENGASSSSEKSTESSSGKNTEPAEVSSCSVAEGSSSSTTVESSSSSVKAEQSSSSEKADASSSSVKVQESSSSVKVEESSSSAKTDASSSSEKPAESSSSEKVAGSSSSEKSSSSVVQSCKTKTEDNCIYGTLYDDRNGKTYKTVKIGEQWWMAENLNLNYQEKGYAVCHCDLDTTHCLKFGSLCYWPAIVDQGAKYNTGNEKCDTQTHCNPEKPVSGICPMGWHVPSLSDFNILITYVGGQDVAGKKLRSRENKGDDSYGFSLLSVITFDFDDEHFKYDNIAYLATSDESGKDRFYNIYFDNKNDGAYRRSEFKTSFASVRCIRD